jgi:hypothetical protein
MGWIILEMHMLIFQRSEETPYGSISIAVFGLARADLEGYSHFKRSLCWTPILPFVKLENFPQGIKNKMPVESRAFCS